MSESRVANLAEEHCVPCHGGVTPLKGDELYRLAGQVPDWKVVEDHHLTRSFVFPDFRKALDFVNRIGAVAEQEGHHPDILLTWGKVDVTTYTHAINGLSENDFILAAKIDRQIPAG